MTVPARLFAQDTDGGFKAAIWGGALAARQTCVSGCVCAATTVFFCLRRLRFWVFAAPRFSCTPRLRNDAVVKNKDRQSLI